MKKLIYSALIVLTASFGYSQNNSQNNETINNGRIIGSFELGSQEVTTILDESTDCVRKTSPHTKGLFTPNENVEIVLKENKQSAEVRKPALPEKVWANKQCVDDVSENFDYLGEAHNQVLDLYYSNSSNLGLTFEEKANLIDDFISQVNPNVDKGSFNLLLNENPYEKSLLEEIAADDYGSNEAREMFTRLKDENRINNTIHKYLIELFDIYDDNYNNFRLLKAKVIVFENSVRNNKSIQDSDKNNLLKVVAISKFSIDFWIENDDILDDITPAATPPWIGKDVAGGATAITSGLVGWASTFGPWGGFVALVGTAALSSAFG